MSRIRLSEELALPLDVVTQTLGILAKRRAGKSYLARRLAEQLDVELDGRRAGALVAVPEIPRSAPSVAEGTRRLQPGRRPSSSTLDHAAVDLALRERWALLAEPTDRVTPEEALGAVIACLWAALGIVLLMCWSAGLFS